MPVPACVSVSVLVCISCLHLCLHALHVCVPVCEWDMPAEAVCVRTPMGVSLQSSFTLLSPFLSITQGFMENPREEVVAAERDLRSAFLCSQSCSGHRRDNISQALRAFPERKASIYLSEGKELFVRVWKDPRAGLALSHHGALGPAQSRGREAERSRAVNSGGDSGGWPGEGGRVGRGRS